MASSPTDNILDIKPGEYPFYNNEKQQPLLDTTRLPQSGGSGLGSDTVDGFNAVSASRAGPNILVATNKSGKLPPTVIDNTSFTSVTAPFLFAMLWGD